MAVVARMAAAFAAAFIALSVGGPLPVAEAAAAAAAERGDLVVQCAYAGANLTDNHLLGLYCLNSMVHIWGYNFTW